LRLPRAPSSLRPRRVFSRAGRPGSTGASRQFSATRSGIQISVDDGPVQVILTVPDRTRVTGVALGGKDKDTLYAFCGNKIWKRKVRHHALGAWSPWTKVTPNKL
jgi:gluconolactonase